MKMYVVEIPQQRTATVWSDDSTRIISVAADINAERDEPIVDKVRTLEDARVVIGHDLHNCYILTGSEARVASKTYSGHQFAAVRAGLERELG